MSGYEVKHNPSLHLMNGRLGFRIPKDIDRFNPNNFESVDETESNEEKEKNHALQLMNNRLGLKVPRDLEQPYIEKFSFEEEGIACQANRLKLNGGTFQQHRMFFDKRKTLDRALLYSYQACDIRRVFSLSHTEEELEYVPKTCRALINPDKLKMDYDDKIVSVQFENGYGPGDVFEWLGTGTFWLIRLQELNEVAYFRGDIRKCSYQISWEDEDGSHSSYVAVRGPVETKINYIQKHQISVDTPNHSLSIYMPRTEAALKYFRRYSKFYLQGMDKASPQVCWRVEATDWISSPGILEITAVEYYANETEDDIENGLVGKLKTEPINPNSWSVDTLIEGPTFIKPRVQYTYKFKGILGSTWEVDDKNYPILWQVNPEDDSEIFIKWDSSYHGQFEIKYGLTTKTIVVESLF